ncbi:MAG: WecB/TagA/CpsF family glycosyltransferase [bacterium]
MAETLEKISFCGLNLAAVTRERVLAFLNVELDRGERLKISTPNAEIINQTFDLPAYRDLINSFDLNLPESTGPWFIANLFGKKLPTRLHGSDFMEDLARLACDRGLGLFLLGDSEGVNQGARRYFEGKYLGLRVGGSGGFKFVNPPLMSVTPAPEPGSTDPLSCHPERSRRVKDDINYVLPEEVVSKVKEFGPCVLLVALGMRKQEFAIAKYCALWPEVKIAMGIGGALAMVSGHLRRAPKLFRTLGLEWLWRLALEPKRIGRIFTAVVVFPIRAIIYRYLSK